MRAAFGFVTLLAFALIGCPRETRPESPARERRVDDADRAGPQIRKGVDRASEPLEPADDDVNEEPNDR